MLVKTCFRDVKVGQRFCFIWMNEELYKNWDVKDSDVLYSNQSGTYSVDKLEDGRDSVVVVEVEND